LNRQSDMRHAASHLKQIVSGAQTGVDRAALDAAMRAGLTVGGWCPRGRKGEDGVIPDIYPLKETRGAAYRTRTRWNVRDADATLILCRGEPSGGTLLTVGFCEELGKPYRIERLRTPNPQPGALAAVIAWLRDHHVAILNVAGPRERKAAPVYERAHGFISTLLARLHSEPKGN